MTMSTLRSRSGPDGSFPAGAAGLSLTATSFPVLLSVKVVTCALPGVAEVAAEGFREKLRPMYSRSRVRARDGCATREPRTLVVKATCAASAGSANQVCSYTCFDGPQQVGWLCECPLKRLSREQAMHWQTG